jgi:hypothetical protein
MGFQHVFRNKGIIESSDHLQLIIDTTIAGVTANDTIRIPLIGTADIDWGDGNTAIGAIGTTDHTYTSGGQYLVTVHNTADSISYLDVNDDTKLLQIKNWGTMDWTTFDRAFKGCSNMVITATDIPDFTTNSVNDIDECFRGCLNLNKVPFFDTSNVINGVAAFRDCRALNTVPNLDFSSLISGSNLFRDCRSIGYFPVLQFDVCTNFTDAFRSCRELLKIPLFNTPLVSGWSRTFNDCLKVTECALLDMSAGVTLNSCFQGCTLLTTIGTFKLSDMTSGTLMFDGVTLDTTDWSDLLIATEAFTVINTVIWDGGNSKYNIAGGVARAALIADHTWTITDGGPV